MVPGSRDSASLLGMFHHHELGISLNQDFPENFAQIERSYVKIGMFKEKHMGKLMVTEVGKMEEQARLSKRWDEMGFQICRQLHVLFRLVCWGK